MTAPTAPWNESGRDSATTRVSPQRPHPRVTSRGIVTRRPNRAVFEFAAARARHLRRAARLTEWFKRASREMRVSAHPAACGKLESGMNAPLGKILIVDDEREILGMLTDHLEDEGYAVSQAIDGEQALESVRSEPRISSSSTSRCRDSTGSRSCGASVGIIRGSRSS